MDIYLATNNITLDRYVGYTTKGMNNRRKGLS
jgi:hypothetical protein